MCKAKYLDREPALVAGHVLACSQRGFLHEPKKVAPQVFIACPSVP